MDRKPLFPFPAKDMTPEIFFRNFECPHYEVCLEEASIIDFHLDCSCCKYKKTRDTESVFQYQLLIGC